MQQEMPPGDSAPTPRSASSAAGTGESWLMLASVGNSSRNSAFRTPVDGRFSMRRAGLARIASWLPLVASAVAAVVATFLIITVAAAVL